MRPDLVVVLPEFLDDLLAVRELLPAEVRVQPVLPWLLWCDVRRRGEHARECPAIDITLSIRSEWVIEVLSWLVTVHGASAFVRSDNGSKFVARPSKTTSWWPGRLRGREGEVLAPYVFRSC